MASTSTAADLGDSGTHRGRVYAGEDLAARRARRRQCFLDAGLELFGTVGYRAATVRALCRQAGLTDRYFYESFASTEDLLIEVYLAQSAVLAGRLATALAPRPNEQGANAFLPDIEVALNAVFEHVSDPRIARLGWVEIMGVSARVDAMYSETMEGFAALVTGVVAQRGLDVSDIDADELRMVGLALVGAVSQCVLHWVLGAYRESRATMVSSTARLFRGLLLTLPHAGDERHQPASG